MDRGTTWRREITKALCGGGAALLFILTLVSHAGAQNCIQPPAGLVSWWPAEGNAIDIAGNNDGTLEGGTTFAPGMVGQAFSFDGIANYIRVPNHPSLNLTSALTIEAWIHSASTEGPHSIVAKWNDNTSDWSYIFKDWDDSDKLSIELSEAIHNDLAALQGRTSIPLGTWVHVATTYDATEGTVRLFFNGLEDASVAVGPNRHIDTSLTDLLIGAVFTGSGITQNFSGLIDEVSIYSRALSPAEIQAIFNAGSAGKCKALTVQIDIKPGGSSNPINPKSHGVTSVAILTTLTFNAMTVDRSTVRFGANGTEAAPVQATLTDVDGDGDTDLLLHFRTQETGIKCGDIKASLTGKTFAGQQITGTDTITTVGCKKK